MGLILQLPKKTMTPTLSGFSWEVDDDLDHCTKISQGPLLFLFPYLPIYKNGNVGQKAL